MQISRFKVFNYISFITITIFGIYAQYQEAINSIYTGVSIGVIVRTLIILYVSLYIPIEMFLVAIKYSKAGQLSKYTLIKTFKISLILTIDLIGTMTIAFSKNHFLWISYISCLIIFFMVGIILKLTKYKKTIY